MSRTVAKLHDGRGSKAVRRAIQDGDGRDGSRVAAMVRPLLPASSPAVSLPTAPWSAFAAAELSAQTPPETGAAASGLAAARRTGTDRSLVVRSPYRA